MAAPSITLHRVNLIRAATPAVALVVWTLFVWVGRIRNIAADDTLRGSALAWRLITAGAFTTAGLALALALVWYVNTRHPFALPVVTWLAGPLAMVGMVFWAIRGTTIALGDYGAGFKVVHSVLALVTIGLGLWVLRWLRR
ncbi:MAG: hypothetical protein AAFN30_01335 [Actinomycetota bacterium]